MQEQPSAAFHALLDRYNYTLPDQLIARTPASPRDSARLLVFDRETDSVTADHTFRDLPSLLPARSVLILNQTKVIPAIIRGTLSNGTGEELLFLGTTQTSDGPRLRALAPRSCRVGMLLLWDDDQLEITAREGKEVLIRPSFDPLETTQRLIAHGRTPLPPYLSDSPLSESARRREYQTVFAREEGSVAAPTAGLHFTDELLRALTDAGHTILTTTLHVNLGTFAPLTEENLTTKRLHNEQYEIDPQSAQAIQTYKEEGRPIVAVGTTVVRTLESAARNERGEVITGSHPLLTRLCGETSLFLSEGDPLLVVDHLITNFHVPRSSLLMLVSAFTGRDRLMEIYRRAIAEECRFLSFGDGMLVV